MATQSSSITDAATADVLLPFGSLDLFTQLMAMLVVSLLITTVFHRIKQPTIIAYIAVGCLLGPFALALVPNPQQFIFIAEFGVVFLLFTLGLEFSLQHLLRMKRAVFLLGGVQVAVCTGAAMLAFVLWGLSAQVSFVLAGALAFSSTAIVTKLLADKQLLNTEYAKLAVGILLFQDLAAIVFLVIAPNLAEGDQNLWAALGMALVKAVLLMALLIVLGRWVLPKIYQEVARSQSSETFILSTLVIVIAAAWLMHAVHLSMALGAFVIGMMLGGSPFRHQIETDISPFRDLFLGLFFIAVGLQIDLGLMLEVPHRILAAVAALMLLKGLLIMVMAKLLGETAANAIKASAILAHGGEFGFALLAVGSAAGLFENDVASFLMLVIGISMLLSPFVINRVDILAKRLLRQNEAPLPAQQADYESMQGHVVIGGFGRIGQTVAHLLEANKIDYVGLDTDAALVRRLTIESAMPLVYGNCSQLSMLESVGIAHARLVILSFKHVQQATQTISQIRERYPNLPIIVRAHNETAFEELVIAGADHVVPEMLEASLSVGMQCLSLLGVDEADVLDQIHHYRDAHPSRAI